ncbi:hypothetical protein FISHEDRAFT_73377 [Fistulina hepatica ATCC 64428]|uniref:Uncharacterized protein n=1 Tax=Fistulina hepatica ATCC 64428 TaxID=1128425 RepID=A0A0D7ACG6_9AGAR|nr:hypothetical protein FISHEDRAFT_73377 [Fistulina hepatica ATCC 64428]
MLVQRVIVSSSVVTVIVRKLVPTIYTGESWNHGCVKEVEDKGADASQGAMYPKHVAVVVKSPDDTTGNWGSLPTLLYLCTLDLATMMSP